MGKRGTGTKTEGIPVAAAIGFLRGLHKRYEANFAQMDMDTELKAAFLAPIERIKHGLLNLTEESGKKKPKSRGILALEAVGVKVVIDRGGSFEKLAPKLPEASASQGMIKVSKKRKAHNKGSGRSAKQQKAAEEQIARGDVKRSSRLADKKKDDFSFMG